MGAISKLEQLRARTDRELVALIDRALDRGLELARSADWHWAGAEKTCAEARKLLPKVYNLGERLRLERKLRELRDKTEYLSAPETPRIRAAAG
jgi:5-methylcytosine-specific restriction endonuclease McrBC GTP-binding regulatory subunit McrB